MISRRDFLLLAILAALLGAPSAALAAPPNAVTAPLVTPPAGTTATTFGFSVQYVSAAGNQATGVTATVAGRTLVLQLTAGTATAGTWTGSATLPAGSWPVMFRAAAAKGPEATVAGPTVSVLPPPTPAVTIAPHAHASTPSPAREATIVGEAGRTATPTAMPADPVATPGPVDSGQPDARPGAVTVQPPAQPAPVASTAAPAPEAEPAASALPGPAGTGASPAAGSTTATTPGPASLGPVGRSPASEGPLGDSTATTWALMVVGLVGVAVVALVGTAWLLIGSRRRRRNAAVGVPAGPAPSAARETTDQLLRRRSRQRARVRGPDDPVLASLGLHEPVDERPRASQVNRGPGMRDASRRRTRD